MAVDDVPPPPPPTRIDITSPYYLGPHDRHGDFITPTRLRGENYDEWAGDIQTVLEARRKFVFLDGTISSPSSLCTQTDWNTIHAMLISWLMNTIDPEVKGTLSKYKDAKRLWDTLKMHFATVNGPRIQQLKVSIAKCEQTKTMSVASYFGKLTALWEELNNHEPLITCACCQTCTAGVEHEKRRENTRLHEFLMGLCTDYYTQTRTNILSQDPLSTLDRAYQLVVQDERVRIAKQTPDEQASEAVGFAFRTSTGKQRTTASDEKADKSGLHCNHCKKHGYVISDCFELKGYPDWWPNPSKRGKPQQTSSKGRAPPRANATAANKADSIGGSSQTFTAEQWRAIAGFIGNTQIPDERLNGEFDNTLWIVDTGGSRHVTCDDIWLFDTSHISHCPVGLPNGKTVNATKEGSVRLSSKIVLKHVLFVLDLRCNLISVSQLIDDAHCTVQFNSNMCALQDQSRELIGTSV
ncbi:uncharacterized protein LOC110701484 [Chenopodium quinoa]|uniref:uncharacterized protein LOC110701484 n=1 Tax=Chenopodium quinoa TaxID=63459 RepID=UPI000B77D033|nr:uncharacterized protein LOC110701484 [Chenopodium quinoa]